MQKHSSEFTALHNRLYSSIFNFIRLRVISKEETEDLVQEVFLKAYNSWDKMPDENSARNFLFHIARQRMIDFWRSSKFKIIQNSTDYDEMENELLDDSPVPEDLVYEDERKKFSLNLLNSLKEEERQIVYLRYIEEREYSEIAEIYKIGEDTARQKVSRALTKIKKVVNTQNLEKI